MKSSIKNAPHPFGRAALLGGSLLLAGMSAHAGMVTDAHGNTGYDTAAENIVDLSPNRVRNWSPVSVVLPAAPWMRTLVTRPP